MSSWQEWGDGNLEVGPASWGVGVRPAVQFLKSHLSPTRAQAPARSPPFVAYRHRSGSHQHGPRESERPLGKGMESGQNQLVGLMYLRGVAPTWWGGSLSPLRIVPFWQGIWRVQPETEALRIAVSTFGCKSFSFAYNHIPSVCL